MAIWAKFDLGRAGRNKPNQLLRALGGEEWPKFGQKIAIGNKHFVCDSSVYSPLNRGLQEIIIYLLLLYILSINWKNYSMHFQLFLTAQKEEIAFTSSF